MSTNKRKQPLTPDEIKKKAKKILQENPTFIKDEPSIVGSPDSLTEDLEKDYERTDTKNS
jgi:D-alanine-D-alanine ligase-like ATP-grasp enzyme